MSVGIWNKIKSFLSKAWSGVKKGSKWLNDKVIKPIIKPALQVVAPAIPYGDTIKKVVDSTSKIADNFTSKKPNYSDVFKEASQMFAGAGPNQRIKFKN